jgi:hypothetical protein
MSKKKVFLFTAVFLLILGGVIFFTPSKTVLAIYNRKNPGERVYSAQGYRNGFIISYTHSVNKGRIHDYYKCDKKSGGLILQSMYFVSYGAGIPEPEEIPGATFTKLDDSYIISDINRFVPELVMAVGVIAEHSFAPIGRDDEIFLKDYFAPQTSLIFKIEKVSLAGYLAHKID